LCVFIYAAVKVSEYAASVATANEMLPHVPDRIDGKPNSVIFVLTCFFVFYILIARPSAET